MKVINPVNFTSGMLISTNATDPNPVYSAATTYAKDAIVSYNTFLYQSLQAGNLNKQPDLVTSSTWWIKIGSDNRYAMFDLQVGQRTTRTSGLTVTVAPGQIIDSVALIDVNALTAVLTVRDGLGGPIVYQRTAGLSGATVIDWYTYFFSDPLQPITQVVFQGIPPYLNAHITLELTVQAGDSVTIGEMVFGSLSVIGTTQYGVSAGIIDYSVKETDEFGNTTFVERPYSKRLSAQVHLQNTQMNRVQRLLYSLRAKPCVWIATDDPSFQESLVIFGFYRDFSTEIAYPSHSMCNIELESLI